MGSTKIAALKVAYHTVSIDIDRWLKIILHLDQNNVLYDSLHKAFIWLKCTIVTI